MDVQRLAQADLVLFAADLFRPPESAFGSFDGLQQANVDGLIDASGLRGGGDLADQLWRAVQSAQTCDVDEWSGCHRLLFDGSIACPINEASYIRRDKGAILGDVCGFYRAFGFKVNHESGERADHLLAELEFVALLLVMSAKAEDDVQKEIADRALADFTRLHVSDWLPAFCERLTGATTFPLFLEAARLLAGIWSALVDWQEWTVDPPGPGAVGFTDEPDDPYECGAPDLVQLRSNPTAV